MQVLVFRSDIELKEKISHLEPLFNEHSDVLNWSIDFEDIDNVIRIEATENLTEVDVIEMAQMNGFHIEPLPE